MNQLEDKYIAGEYTPFSGQILDVHVPAEHVHQSGDENCFQHLESEQQHPPLLKKQCTRNKGALTSHVM